VIADVHRELTARRADYPMLAGTTYLANHALGAMHRDVPQRLADYAELWATRGALAWDTWQPELHRVADLVGATVGAPAGTTVLRQSVADLVGAFASCLDLSGRRNRIVYADEVEWPGSHYLWREQARVGADVVSVPISNDGGITLDEQRLVDAIDGRTALVYVSAVLFRTSTIIDVAPIVAKAHAAGAFVVLDAYQAAGTLPLDVVALDVDACVGGSMKYLCGGPGAGWMYVAPRLSEVLRPSQVGWFGHAHPFEFAFADIDYAEGVQRFAGGTPGVPAAYAAGPGASALLEVGLAQVRERSVSLTQPLVEAALERGWQVNSPVDPARRGGHVSIDPGDSERVCDTLIAQGIAVDHLPGVGLRAGPHFFTEAAEVEAFLAAVAAAAPTPRTLRAQN
jgi:kynureninase